MKKTLALILSLVLLLLTTSCGGRQDVANPDSSTNINANATDKNHPEHDTKPSNTETNLPESQKDNESKNDSSEILPENTSNKETQDETQKDANSTTSNGLALSENKKEESEKSTIEEIIENTPIPLTDIEIDMIKSMKNDTASFARYGVKYADSSIPAGGNGTSFHSFGNKSDAHFKAPDNPVVDIKTDDPIEIAKIYVELHDNWKWSGAPTYYNGHSVSILLMEKLKLMMFLQE